VKDDKLIRSYITTLPTLSNNAIKERDVNEPGISTNSLPYDSLKALNPIDDIYKLAYNINVPYIKLN
jgi:hypothetical protein